MRLEAPSTLAAAYQMRTATLSLRVRLDRAQLELSSGRHADMGLALGQGTARSISWRNELAELGAMRDRINLAREKVGVTQAVLDSINGLADSFMSALAGARSAEHGAELLRGTAAGAMSSLQDLLNTTYDGQYVFGGLNGTSAPLVPYQGSAGELAFSVMFNGTFGFGQGDPQLSDVNTQQMESFLSGPFGDLFEAGSWPILWTGAAQQLPAVRLGPNHTVTASVSASAPAFATLTRALVMVSELAQDALGQAPFQVMVDSALALVGEAKAMVALEQARIGDTQSQMSRTVERLERREISLTASIGFLESVDPYEAASRVNTLMNQLEMSYTITGRLQNLNLMNYI